MIKRNQLIFSLMLIFLVLQTCQNNKTNKLAPIKVSQKNNHFFAKHNGEPFFWLGDTGWLLFSKLNRKDAEKYLENRNQKGFNVIQTSIIHNIEYINIYGDTALVNQNVTKPKITEGINYEDPAAYDFWDHVEFVIDKAAEYEIYMGLIPIWGSNVDHGYVNKEQAEQYAKFLEKRFGDKPNIFWINGGDTRGNESTEIWNIIGNTLGKEDPHHLITFHPFGRHQSSMWFHKKPWLDFNMFQSGHRRYDQDDTKLAYGPSNWKYVNTSYNKNPIKPVIDGEPSYEEIPEGLHDTSQPYWDADDIRRYAYWSVFAGAAGQTYGHNAVMQFHKPSDAEAAYGAKQYWYEAINDTGAADMQHMKNLMLSRPYFERIPDQSLVAGKNGKQYEYIAATRGKSYAFLYTYTGRTFKVQMGKIEGKRLKAAWYSPRNGKYQKIGKFQNSGIQELNPPGKHKNGNDWVLVLDSLQ